MANEIALKLESERFNAALQRYLLSSKKTAREVINRASLNLAFEAMNQTKRAKLDEIKRLGTSSDPKRHIWYKYIAKIISRTGYIFKKRSFKTVTVDGKKKRVLSGVNETGVHGKYTVDEARKVSNAIKAKRARAIGYVASGWLPAVEYFWKRVKDKPFRRGGKPKQFGAPNGRYREFGPDWNPQTMIENHATGSVKVATKALQSAMRVVGVDMIQYLQRKMQENARKAKYGGK